MDKSEEEENERLEISQINIGQEKSQQDLNYTQNNTTALEPVKYNTTSIKSNLCKKCVESFPKFQKILKDPVQGEIINVVADEVLDFIPSKHLRRLFRAVYKGSMKKVKKVKIDEQDMLNMCRKVYICDQSEKLEIIEKVEQNQK